MDAYLIKSFRGGFSEYEDKGREGSFKSGTKNIDIRKVTDSLSCQQALTDDLAAGTFNEIAHFIIPASDGNTYIFLKNGRIYKRTSAGVYTLVYTDTNVATDGAKLTGAAEYYNNVGDVFVYWCSGTRLNRKRILDSSGAAINTNWSDVNATVNAQTYPKTDLTSTDWHIMQTAGDSNLYVGNKNKLAIVGYDDTYQNEALRLLASSIVVPIVERGLDLVMGANRTDGSVVSDLYKWDTINSLNWNTKKPLPASNINALVEGALPLAQVGTNGLVFYSDLYNFDPVTRFPNGGYVNPAGVEVDGALTLFGVFGAGTGYNGIYSYGRKDKNSPECLNLEYQFDCDEIGAVKKIGSTLLFTYKNGSNYGVKKVDLLNKAVGVYRYLDLKCKPGLLDEGATWDRIVLTTSPLPDGASITCTRRVNKTGSFTSSDMEGNDLIFNEAGAMEATFNIGDLGKIFEFELTLNPINNESPEIYKIELFFTQ